MNKKSLLYIGHSYHNKTKSTAFLKELLEKNYHLTVFDFSPDTERYDKLLVFKDVCFDCLVLFQIMPDLEKLKQYINTKKIVFFPMYDAVEHADFKFWCLYKEAKIINFSKILHEKLLTFGLDTNYIQYFPKPIEKEPLSKGKVVYFWQRVSSIHLGLVEKLFSKIKVDKFLLHKALDPSQQFVTPSKSIQKHVEYSSWYATKEEMFLSLQKANIYIAPRPTEGIGMSFLEAMAMGLCVVANDKPTMNEYIKQGETGILYHQDNIEPLDDFDAVQIGKNAQNYIKQGYEIWENEKVNILKWMEEPVQINQIQMEKQICTVTYFLFSFLEILKIRVLPHVVKIHLFRFIPLFYIKK